MRLLTSDNTIYAQLPQSMQFGFLDFCAAKSHVGIQAHLQNPSTDVSAAGLTFHPVLGVVIRLAVWHSISVM